MNLERVQGGVCQCQPVIEVDCGVKGDGEQRDLEIHERAARAEEGEAFKGAAVDTGEVRQLAPREVNLCALEVWAGKMREVGDVLEVGRREMCGRGASIAVGRAGEVDGTQDGHVRVVEGLEGAYKAAEVGGVEAREAERIPAVGMCEEEEDGGV